MATKTEERLLERVREANDRGQSCCTPVQDKKGARRSWRRGGGYEGGGKNKVEQAAWEKMVARGDVIPCPWHGEYAVPGHQVLVKMAATLDLSRRARHIEELRQVLEREQTRYAECEAFIRKYGLGIV